MNSKELIKHIEKSNWITAIEKSGSQIFLVGGAVRDIFLGKDSKDLDFIVTKTSLENLSVLLAKFGKVDLVGESFAVIKFKPTDSEFTFDIAVPRKDRKIGDGHKGFEIETGEHISLEDDLFRRDFSINSIAMTLAGDIIDPFDGIKDLSSKIIAATNPNAFADDALRILRAVQFAARFKFEIHEDTLRMMKQNIHLLKDISGERITEEFAKIITKKGSVSIAFRLLSKIGFFETLGLKHNSSMSITDGDFKTLGDFMHLILFFDKDIHQTLAQRFRVDNDIKKQVKALTTMHELADSNVDWRLIAAAMVKVTSDSFSLGCVFSPVAEILVKMSTGELVSKVTDLDISGDDLIKMGKQGKEIGTALNTLFELVLFGKIPNTKVALETVVAQLDSPRAKSLLSGTENAELGIRSLEGQMKNNEILIKQLVEKNKDLKKKIKIFEKQKEELLNDYHFHITNSYNRNRVNLETQAAQELAMQQMYESRDISEAHLSFEEFNKLLKLREKNEKEKQWALEGIAYRVKRSENTFKVGDPVTVTKKFNNKSETLHGYICKASGRNTYGEQLFEVELFDGIRVKSTGHGIRPRIVEDLSKIEIPECLKKVSTERLLRIYRTQFSEYGRRDDSKTYCASFGQNVSAKQIKAELKLRQHIENKNVAKYKNKK